jgi:hypothetical protein
VPLVCVSGGVSLTGKTREAHWWVWMYGEAGLHCCDSHLHCGQEPVGFDTLLGSSHTTAPSDQQVHSKVSLRRAVDAV